MSAAELRRLPITVAEAMAIVDEIAATRDDDEHAHELEDDLRERVLRTIAAGTPDAKTLAQIAIATSEIEFARHCA